MKAAGQLARIHRDESGRITEEGSMLKKVILLYNIESLTYRKALEDFCRDRDISLRYVKAEEYDVPLGFLAYGKEEDRAEYIRQGRGREFKDPMMVFSGFDQDALFAIFKDLRAAGIVTTDLKAVMTEHNAVWDSLALRSELLKEHLYMKEMAAKSHDKKQKQ